MCFIISVYFIVWVVGGFLGGFMFVVFIAVSFVVFLFLKVVGEALVRLP